LVASDLATLGIYLFGPRWQSAMARAIHRSDRLVRRWVAEDSLVSIVASATIEQLVREKHGRQMKYLRATYLNMIASLSDTALKGRLLTMDLSQLRTDNQLRQAAALLEADLALLLIAEPLPSPILRLRDAAD
jgi:hypothetical protein